LKSDTLTTAAIKNMTVGSVLWDRDAGAVPGLHLRAFKDEKVFYVFYRLGKQQRRPRIGSLVRYNITSARIEARKILRQVESGVDPMAARVEAKGAIGFSDLVARYVECVKSDPKEKKSSWLQDKNRLNKYVVPVWGDRPAASITVDDVEDLHKSLAAIPYQANRVLSILSRLFNLSEKWRIRPQHSNPCRNVSKYKETKRKRYLTEDEFPRVWRALADAEKEYPRETLFIRLMMATGARPSELADAHMTDIEKVTDRAGSVSWRIVLRKHKTAEATGEDRIIHLPAMAVEWIAALPRSDDLICGNSLAMHRKHWWRIRAAAGVPDVHLHDLRHTWASLSLLAGHSYAEIGQSLGHASSSMARRYSHLMDDGRAAVSEKTAAVLRAMLIPAPTPLTIENRKDETK